jgi:hypothetical protein
MKDEVRSGQGGGADSTGRTSRTEWMAWFAGQVAKNQNAMRSVHRDRSCRLYPIRVCSLRARSVQSAVDVEDDTDKMVREQGT